MVVGVFRLLMCLCESMVVNACVLRRFVCVSCGCAGWRTEGSEDRTSLSGVAVNL